DWIEELKSGGSVPFLHPDNCSNGWATPPGDIFKVRGSDYLRTKEKIPAGDYLLKPLGFDWLKGSTKLSELLTSPENRIKKALDHECSKPHQHPPLVWAFNLQLPTKENHSAVAYFVGIDPLPDDSLITRFLKGDDAFRDSRLKLIANIVKGPWIVRTAVGEQAICIIGRALRSKYSLGEHFIEVDIDVGSSVVANAIVHLAFGYLTTLTVDLAFLIEGQQESELPERVLGAFRISGLDADSAGQADSEVER
ncbi:lipid binding protein, partial [Genlisea aurea]